MTATQPIIFWFRQDLRLTDLPGLTAAARSGKPVLALYLLDDESPGRYHRGAASRWWLHHSLQSLQHELEQAGGSLLLRRGSALDVLPQLAEEVDAAAVYCSACAEPWAVTLERELRSALARAGTEFRRFPGNLLFAPDAIRNRQDKPFRVFTRFWQTCQAQPTRGGALGAPLQDIAFYRGQAASLDLDELALLPGNPDWAAGWSRLWRPGSHNAQQVLDTFLTSALTEYAEQRDFPAADNTSHLSPHLHFGELSPLQVWNRAHAVIADNPDLQRYAEPFLRQLGWREFNHHLLYNFPHIADGAFKDTFNTFPWQRDARGLRAWQRGMTGYPIVDAGMRQLWQTGYMHNRVRMICASFLTKHLRVHWREGESWFWDTLVDADLANNLGGWQWVAGCGADAAPYFRIFNPTLQGNKFDPDGTYVRRWVPELAQLDNRHIHEPAAAPASALQQAGVTLGKDYPLPLVDHKEARATALAAYRATTEARVSA